MRRHPNDDGRNLLFEFKYIGQQVRVAVIDPETAEESCYIGSKITPRDILVNNARYALFSKLSKPKKSPSNPPPSDRRSDFQSILEEVLGIGYSNEKVAQVNQLTSRMNELQHSLDQKLSNGLISTDDHKTESEMLFMETVRQIEDVLGKKDFFKMFSGATDIENVNGRDIIPISRTNIIV